VSLDPPAFGAATAGAGAFAGASAAGASDETLSNKSIAKIKTQLWHITDRFFMILLFLRTFKWKARIAPGFP